MLGILRCSGIGEVLSVNQRDYDNGRVTYVSVSINKINRTGEKISFRHSVEVRGDSADDVREGDTVFFDGEPTARVYDGSDGEKHASMSTRGFIRLLSEDERYLNQEASA